MNFLTKYEEIECIMLPASKETRGRTKLHLANDGKLFYTNEPVHLNLEQHLYFLSLEEIKEGDYVLSTYDKWAGTGNLKPQIGQIKEIKDNSYLIDSFNGDEKNFWNKGYSKKIIATTDETLKINLLSGIKHAPANLRNLPRPSDDFLKIYVKVQGKVFKKLLVEYEQYIVEHDNDQGSFYDYRLKVNNDNTINIQIKEKKITKQDFRNFIRTYHLTKLWDEWVKNNLN